MTGEEVLALLAYATELDGRHAPNELKVAAWLDVLDAEAPGVSLQFARDVVREHYSRTDDMLTVSHLVARWRLHREADRAARSVTREVVEREPVGVPDWWSRSREGREFGEFLASLAAMPVSTDADGFGDAHCGRAGCACIHRRGCFKGWMAHEVYAVPCGVCRSSLAAVLDELPPPGLRSAADLTRLRTREAW